NRISLETIRGSDPNLLKEWSPLFLYENFWKQAIKGETEGFQIISTEPSGRKHLEGWVTFDTRDGFYISSIRIAPGNQFRERYKGIGSVLVARLIEESNRRGFDGAFSIFLVGAESEFFKKMGALPGEGQFPYWEVDPITAESFLASQLDRTEGIPVYDL